MAGRDISEYKIQWTNKKVNVAMISPAHLVQLSLEMSLWSTLHSTWACLSTTASTKANSSIIQNPAAQVHSCCQGKSFIGPATPCPFWTLRKSIDYTPEIGGQQLWLFQTRASSKANLDQHIYILLHTQATYIICVIKAYQNKQPFAFR